MRLAIVGSRTIRNIAVERYVSDDVEEIVSGGATGVDTCAAEYAKRPQLGLTVFLPQYERYGRAAPVVRNQMLVDYADRIIVFWDGFSKGSKSVIHYAKKRGKPLEIVLLDTECNEKTESP